MKNLAFFTFGFIAGTISIVTFAGGLVAGAILGHECNKKDIAKKESKQMSYTSYMN